MLRKNNLLVPLVRNQLIEQMTADLKPPEELVRKALEKHCQNQKFKDEAELTEWLKDNYLSRDELLNQLSLPLKLSKFALDHYGLQAEARFLQCKEELDQVIYSLVRVKDSGMAYELYLQLEANEASFETLASDHSEGPEQRSGGRVGPGSLKRAHPRLQQLLRTATPGVVQEPILIEQWWVVTRLDERQEASFDDAMRQRMASELLQDWLTNETKAVVKSLFSADDGISMP
jgi:parvulin-like peptidyl-prolyl isomerase